MTGWKGVIAGAAGTLLLLILICLLIALTGGYNIAATDRHSVIIAWALETTRINSVQGAAKRFAAPVESTPSMVEAGAGEYKAMCVQCHGGIGESREEWARTMEPRPPDLARATRKWSPEEVFWIVKHGLKMTGMPAFGPSHDDETLWNIVAFVEKLPKMSEREYKSYAAAHGAHEDRQEPGGGHSHASGTPSHHD